MNKLVVLTVLMIGVSVGWLLRVATEPVPVVVSQSTSLPESALEMGERTKNLLLGDKTNVPSSEANRQISVVNEQHAQGFDELTALLNTGRDAEAIDWYATQGRSHSNMKGMRRLINQHVNRREQQNDVAGAIQLLKLLIGQLPQAFDERVVLALLYQRQQQFYEALTVIFDTLTVASSTAELTQLDLLVEQTVKSAKKAIGDDDINAQVKLYEFLIQHRAAHTPYYIELAAWLIKASRLDAAIAQLTVVEHDPFVGDVAQQMLQEIDRQRLRLLETPITLLRKGSHFMVDASLNQQDVRLLIDTGASFTVLSRSAAQQLGLQASDAVKKIVVNTANGTTEALLYRIESMALGVFTVSSIDIAVVEQLQITGAAGLLGMNFLEQFDFRIDQQDAQLFLKYRD